MPPKTSRHGDSKSFLDQMRERGEEAVSQVFDGLIKNRGLADQLGKTLGRAARAKRTVDRNMQYVLSALNLPSRADYNRLLAKIESLQGSLVNLSMKLDRILAQQHSAPPHKPPSRRKTKPAGDSRQ
jgi:hypothetical protein